MTVSVKYKKEDSCMLKFKRIISVLMTAVLLTSMFSSVVVLNAFASADNDAEIAAVNLSSLI